MQTLQKAKELEESSLKMRIQELENEVKSSKLNSANGSKQSNPALNSAH